MVMINHVDPGANTLPYRKVVETALPEICMGGGMIELILKDSRLRNDGITSRLAIVLYIATYYLSTALTANLERNDLHDELTNRIVMEHNS
jgi:hypothetical protein